MISKPVPANSFYHTCRYICNKPGAEVLVTEGVRGHDYKLMAHDFETQQQLRLSKSQACFHSILSFYPGENPTDAVMVEIAKKYLTELGIVDTQYAISKHTDRAHLHLHIIANMVNNEGKVISDSWIGLRGKKIAQQLTQEYRLIPALEKNLGITNLEALSQADVNKYKIYSAIAENLPRCLTMDELEKRLLQLGIKTQYKYKGQTREKQGISFKLDDICIKGSQVDRKFSLAGLEKTLELQRKQVQEQPQEQEQKPEHVEGSSSKKINNEQTLQANTLQKGEKKVTHGLTVGLENFTDILMKPEQASEQMAGLTKEIGRRKKKKRSQQFKR